jgi:hypothetical protein
MTAEPALRTRNRRMLLAIAVLFLGSFLVAGLLRFSGWRPEGLRNKGELLQPYGDLRAVTPRLVDGGSYQWNPAARLWRIAVAPPDGCGQPCVELAGELDTVWRLFGRNADQVHLLWIGEPPAQAAGNASTRVLRDDPALRAGLPRVDDPAGVPVYVIDPNGFVILRYAPGFDPADLRSDVARLLKLR